MTFAISIHHFSDEKVNQNNRSIHPRTRYLAISGKKYIFLRKIALTPLLSRVLSFPCSTVTSFEFLFHCFVASLNIYCLSCVTSRLQNIRPAIPQVALLHYIMTPGYMFGSWHLQSMVHSRNPFSLNSSYHSTFYRYQLVLH